MLKVSKILSHTAEVHEFYHGTKAVDINETIAHYKQGIDPSKSNGFGQGDGYYLWVTKQKAVSHIEEVQDDRAGDPCIVTLKADLTPENFDIDHEVMAEYSLKLIWDNWDTGFKKLPEGSVIIDGKPLSIEKSYKSQIGTMIFKFPNAQVSLSPNSEGGIRQAQVSGPIFNAIQKYLPQMARDFEMKVFPLMIKEQEGAVKYVGPKIMPFKIEKLVNGQWTTVQ